MALDIEQEMIRQVETMSMGLMTVRLTAKGGPSYFYRLKKFNREDIHPTLFGTGVHPAFIVGGVTKDEILIGTQAAVDIDGEGLSQTGREPKVSISHDNAVTMMRATGSGFCVATNAMYAALALLIRKDQKYPRGNTQYGRHHVETGEYGLRPDGAPAIGGNVNGNTVVRTGTGPVSWNWPRNPFGIQGLTGNIWEWAPGMRLNGGEINVIANNDAALAGADLSAGSAAWKAIDRTDGSLVAPGSADTVKYASSGTADGTLVHAGTGGAFSGMTAYGISTPALQLLRTLALMPPDGANGMLSDGLWYNPSLEQMPIRGGSWNYGAAAGPFALYVSNSRGGAGASLGFRPAFVI